MAHLFFVGGSPFAHTRAHALATSPGRPAERAGGTSESIHSTCTAQSIMTNSDILVYRASYMYRILYIIY